MAKTVTRPTEAAALRRLRAVTVLKHFQAGHGALVAHTLYQQGKPPAPRTLDVEAARSLSNLEVLARRHWDSPREAAGAASRALGRHILPEPHGGKLTPLGTTWLVARWTGHSEQYVNRTLALYEAYLLTEEN